MKPWKDGHFISDHIDPNHPAHSDRLHRRLELLGTFDYRAALGPETTLDQVKTTRWKPSFCNCELTYVYHRDSSEDNRLHIAQDQHFVCNAHSEHTGKLDQHFAQLSKESKAFGDAAEIHAAKHDIPVEEIEKKIIDGQLRISHPAFGERIVELPKAN